MDLKFLPTIMAAEDYNCGAYGEGSYNETQCATATNSGGSLADTGYDILVPLALGLAVIIASVILLVKRIRRAKA